MSRAREVFRGRVLWPWAGAFSLAAGLGACGFEEFQDCSQAEACGQGGGTGDSSGNAGVGGVSGSGGVGAANAGGATSSEATGGDGEGGAAEPGRGGEGGSLGEGGETGDAGAGGGPPLEPECDATAHPREAPCRVTERSAVFVAPDGDDAGPGTRAKPLASFKEALVRAAALADPDPDADGILDPDANARIVIACSGEYAEALVVEALVVSAEGVAIFGGFDCTRDWRPHNALSVLAPAMGIPLVVRGVTDEVVIDGLELRAPDATLAGGNSVAAFVASAEQVVFRNTWLVAGRARAGENGVLNPYVFAAPEALAGVAPEWCGVTTPNPYDCAGGGRLCQCPNGTQSRGGGGGHGGLLGSPVWSGTPGQPARVTPGGEGGLFDVDYPVDAACHGRSGGAGLAGRPVDPVTTLGTLNANGWRPRAGANGIDGEVGQGGGGGGGTDFTQFGSGGGGACGGCGGKGGSGGKGGGASIALLVYASQVEATDAVFISQAAGDGGIGTAGQPGQAGGVGGPAAVKDSTCAGGDGGSGGNGGAAAGGPGGVSAGILHSGAAPVLHGATFTVGAAGRGGLGGASGQNDGPNGIAAEVVAL